jgi:two-component system response regulator YesN
LFRESTRRFVLLLGAASPARATEIAEACCANIRKFTKFTVSIGVGAPAQDVVDLPSSYREALTALSYQYYTGGDGVFHIDAAARVGAGRPAHSQRLEESLAFALQSGNAELAAETLDALVREMKELRPYPQPEAAAETVAEWAALVCRALHGRVSDEKLAPLVERARALRAQRGLSLTRQRELVLALATDGCKLMLEERQHESRKTIRRAAEFIQSHLGEELSVDRCAREVNLSGGYFANLFKKEMGVTFNQYVTQERIDRAKKLLVAGVPVQDIALDLGYEHRRYFSDVFKKHTGMTPSDFKEFYARGASLD